MSNISQLTNFQNLKNLTTFPSLKNKSEFDSIVQTNLEKIDVHSVPDQVTEIDEPIPKFVTVSKLDFEGAEIHGGIINDSTSKSGLR